MKDFHHYKGNEMTPAEKVEQKYAQLLIDSDVPDEKRKSSIIWELKHSSGCCQIARVLAEKRGLNIEISETAALLHDIYVATTGKYSNHAALGGPLAETLLREVGGFSPEDIEKIVNAIVHHSEKEIYSDDPYVELVKDVDVFDCSLYRGSGDYYHLHKPAEIVKEYAKRTESVRKELGLPQGNTFRK